VKDPVTITLLPLGMCLHVPRGTPLRDVLFTYGVEFPCGGQAQCEGCKVRVLKGTLPVTPEQEAMLSPEDLAAGWRLACRCRANHDLTLELAQWEAKILVDNSPFQFTPREGLGVAIDCGTTTLAAQLVDLTSGTVLGVQTALNEQARYGADIMRRVDVATTTEGRRLLTGLIRAQLGGMVHHLLIEAAADPRRLRDIAVVGNTVMHHLFCGLDCSPLAGVPFEPRDAGAHQFRPAELGWPLPDGVTVTMLPCIGGFVGSDILAGILSTRLHEQEKLSVLIDLGTNGEIVMGNRNRLVCCSTAAGPAFEGARISMGMRATTGAITEVRAHKDRLSCRVVGDITARGICGSGLVDAIAAGLDLGIITANGRVAGGSFPLCGPVTITQADVREVQTAKGAIAAGTRILLEHLGATPEDVAHVYLAGAFGNYVNRTSAYRIGLLHFDPRLVTPAGNTALHGAKFALFPEHASVSDTIRSRCVHISLNTNAHFQDIFVEEMAFALAS
jgi:uncharacterized 2Fe-2S/4Fe-4S cluster protein (DUF4445 family)